MLIFLSAGTDRCDVETSILRSLGLHFGTLGDHFGIILQSLGLLGCPLGAFGAVGSNFESIPGKSLPHFGVPFGTQNLKSRRESQNAVSRKQYRKNVLPEPARKSPMCDPYSKYHMFGEVEQHPFR